MSVVIKFKRLRQSAQLPVYQTQHAAGMDLAADVSDTVFVAPHERRAIPTGLTIEIPPGYEGQVRPRSGRAINEGLTMINSPGTIDADYRGEVKVLIVNFGGPGLFRSAKSFFIGLILGEVGAAALWLVVSLLLNAMGMDYRTVNLMPT